MKRDRAQKQVREQAEKERVARLAAAAAPGENPGAAGGQTCPVTAAPSAPRALVAAGISPAPPSAVPREGSSFPGVPAVPGSVNPLPGGSRGGSFLQHTQPQPMRSTPSAESVRGRGGLAVSRGRGGFTHNNNDAHLHLQVQPHSSPDNNLDTDTTTTTTAMMNAPAKGQWAQWDCLSVFLSDLPDYINTFQLWDAFRAEGEIDSIDLWEDARGKREGKAKVRFR